MESGIRLGRIAGIRVDANWSVLVVFWLIAWSLATVTLPDRHPGSEVAVYWLAGTVAALLFLASLLGHELAHALVARSRGVAVEGITLWLFGGVSKLSDEPATPSAELRIAIAGPATSLGAALVFFLVARGLDVMGSPDLVVGVAEWLALVNVLLGGFNLLPGAPLDGGRVLRAAVWRRSGSRHRATRVASQVGRSIAYGLIVLGLVGIAMGGFLGGLWFIFLGWFLLSAARSEETASLLRLGLAGVKVREVMTRNPTVAPAGISVSEMIDTYVMRHRFSGFPVVSPAGEIVGFVSLSDLKRVPAELRETTPVVDVSVRVDDVVKVSPDDALFDLIVRLNRSGESRALVYSGGEMIGIVSPSDIARAIDIATLVAPDREMAGGSDTP